MTGDFSGHITVTDPDSGEVIRRTQQGHRSSIAGLDVHPGRPLAVSSSPDGTVRLWNLETMTEKWSKPAGNQDWPQGSHECAFSPDGTRIAAGANDGRLRILDTEDGSTVRELRLAEGESVYSTPSFSPDGRRVVARVWGKSSRLAVWDLSSGRELWHTTGARLSFISPQFSSDGTRVFACTDNGTLLVCDASTGVRFATFATPSPQQVVSIAVYGTIVVSTTDKAVRFWDGTPIEKR